MNFYIYKIVFYDEDAGDWDTETGLTCGATTQEATERLIQYYCGATENYKSLTLTLLDPDNGILILQPDTLAQIEKEST